MKNVFVVMGTTGEYSDHNEWAVMAYLDEAQAQEHVVNADRRAKELFATRQDRYSIEKGANEFDPDMSMDYTGTSYFIYTVPLAKKSGLTKRAADECPHCHAKPAYTDQQTYPDICSECGTRR